MILSLPAKIPPPPPRHQNPPPTSSFNPLLHRRVLLSELSAGHLTTLSLLSRTGSHPDPLTFSLLLKMALSLFHSMGPLKTLVSFSAIISCFASSPNPSESLSYFIEMLREGQHHPNEFIYASVLRACSNSNLISTGDVVFGMAVKTGYAMAHVCVACSAIDMFVKGDGAVWDAYKVFERVTDRDAVAWSLMITRFAQSGEARKSVEVFAEMLVSGGGVRPDQFTLSGVLSGCKRMSDLELGKGMHSWAARSGLALDHCVACCLVDMYAKCGGGAMSESRKVFDRMEEHSVISWTALINGYVQSGACDEEAFEVFVEMVSGGCVSPNHFTFASVLKACAGLSDGRKGGQVHALAVKLGLVSVNCVGNSLISMYAKSGLVDEARKAFDVLYEKNLVSYNTIVDAYAKNLDADGAFELLNEVENTGLGASAFTFASLLSGAASLCAVDKGEQIHSRVIKSGFESNQSIRNALVSMYSRCGNIDAAFQVFNEMDDRNVISWTSMITGFAKHGYAARGVKVFYRMRSVAKCRKLQMNSLLTSERERERVQIMGSAIILMEECSSQIISAEKMGARSQS